MYYWYIFCIWRSLLTDRCYQNLGTLFPSKLPFLCWAIQLIQAFGHHHQHIHPQTPETKEYRPNIIYDMILKQYDIPWSLSNTDFYTVPINKILFEKFQFFVGYNAYVRISGWVTGRVFCITITTCNSQLPVHCCESLPLVMNCYTYTPWWPGVGLP